MSTYTAAQLALVREMKKQAAKRYSDPHERMVKLKSAIATGIVEKNLTNTAGGDADSSNWRQERASGYGAAWKKTGGPLNAGASINRYFDEADQLWDGKMDSAELAARVQRPAAQYRSRYGLHDVQSKAQQLAQGSGKGVGTAAPTVTVTGKPGSIKATGPSVTPGTTKVDEQGALVDALLNKRGGSLLKRYTANVDSGAYTTTTEPTVSAGSVKVKAGTLKKTYTAAAKDKTAAPAGIHGSHVLELIYNDGGKGFGIKDGSEVDGKSVFGAVWDGHKTHVHVAAGPETIVELGKLAKSMGLHVGENPHFGGVNPVHAQNSYHYKGEAIDVSGDPAKMKKYAQEVAAYNRSRRR